MRISDIVEEYKWFQKHQFITFDKPTKVVHTTSGENKKSILRDGFKTGKDIKKGEKRGAIYFSDITVNPEIYARNKEFEENEGDISDTIEVDIKNLNLLNIGYKTDSGFVNHKKYNGYVIRGELEKIPFNIDGTVSFLDDGRIYEVALFVDVANKLLGKY